MSSLSTSLYGASTNKGVGGLLSGLNTDDLVKQMTASTRNKINRQYQSKQKLLYKQESYREISTKLLSFSNKYFSYSTGSKTNILSSSFFKAHTFKSSSDYVNVSGNADNIKNFSIESITSVATAASFSSNKKVTSGVVESDPISDYVSSLAGETMTLNYDGKTYNLTLDADFGKGLEVDRNNVVDQLNKQLAKIEGNESLGNLKYKLDADKIVLAKTEMIGETEVTYKTATLTAASSDVINILNMKVGQEASSTEDVAIEKLTLSAESIFSNKDNFISFEYNGVVKKINLNVNLKLASDVASYIQTEINKAYGENKITVEYNDTEGTGTKSFIFNINGDTNVFGISSISKDLNNLTGLESGDYNRLNKTKSIVELGLKGISEENAVELSNGKKGFIININNTDIEIESTMSVTDVINKINNNAEAGVKVYYSSITDTFSVNATETGSHKGIDITTGENTLAQALFGTVDTYKPGTDTEMTYTLNGVKNTIQRSAANFTIDEINIELNEKAVGKASIATPITFDVTNNSDEVVEKIKQFIDEYNEIINLIGTKTSEKPNKGYLPLTPEQLDEMKEEEIKTWNVESKKGTLFGDQNMTNILRSMRDTMSGLTDVSSITLSSIGISSASMDTSGKLVLDEKKFKEKLLEKSDEIANLFTSISSKTENAKSGIALQLRSILRSNVGTYGTTGILIDEAGLSNSMTSDRNYISEKVKQHDDKMAKLKDDLEVERKRYWNQFSSLESSLNKLNAQSSWLTDMMGQ